MNTKRFGTCLSIVSLSCILIAQTAIAQPEIDRCRFYGGVSHSFRDVFQTDDHGYAMAGSANGNAWVMRMNEAGDQQWQLAWDMLNDGRREFLNSVIETDNHDIVAGGSISDQVGADGNGFLGCRVNANGQEVIWERRYQADRLGACRAVIETKHGQLLFGGFVIIGADYCGYVAITDDQGEIVHEITFNPALLTSANAILEAPDNGFFLAGGSGQHHDGALVHIDSDGEIVDAWHYPTDNFPSGFISMVSVRDGYVLGGFCATAPYRQEMLAVKVDGDGRFVWSKLIETGNITAVRGLARFADNSVILCGTRDDLPQVAKLDESGNIDWITYPSQPFHRRAATLYSAIANADQELIVVGSGQSVAPEGERGGFLLRFQKDVDGPTINDYTPDSLNLKMLPFETKRFWVSAHDAHYPVLTYTWSVDGVDSVGRSYFRTQFADLGMHNLKCVVSDSIGADSIAWNINVVDLFVLDSSPDTLDLSLRRGTTQTFSIDSVATVEGDPVQYQWALTNLNNNEMVDAGTEPRATVEFLRSGNYRLEGLAYRGDAQDNVIWTIQVRSAILDFWPAELDLSVNADSLVNFEVLAFNPESDSLMYRWELDGDSVGSDSAVGLRFPWRIGNPPYRVAAIVMDGAEGDTVTWEVTVAPTVVGGTEGASERVSKWGMLSASPNPFNASTTIRFSFAAINRGKQRLAVYGLDGRLIEELWNDRQAGRLSYAGEHTAVFNGMALPAGIYLLRLQTGGESFTTKLILPITKRPSIHSAAFLIPLHTLPTASSVPTRSSSG